jgi:SAM-dependent methyltransferase
MTNRLFELIRQRNNRKDLYSSEAYWDSKAEKYDDTAVSMWPNQVLNELYEIEQKQVINKYFGDTYGLSLLDLGCGTGRFSRWFAKQGAVVNGVDFSARSLNIAKKISSGPNPSYQYGSVFDMYEKSKYDRIFTWGVLTIACRDKNQLVDALIRIRLALKPGGCLLLTEPIHSGFLHRVLDLNLNEFLDVMRKAGFHIKEVTPLHFWPARLVLAYAKLPAWLTSPIYFLGQAMMKIPRLSMLGDYWAIQAYRVD